MITLNVNPHLYLNWICSFEEKNNQPGGDRRLSLAQGQGHKVFSHFLAVD